MCNITSEDNNLILKQEVRLPLSRSKSSGIFRTSKRNSTIPNSQSPLHPNPIEGVFQDTDKTLSSGEGLILNAPIHSNISSESINFQLSNAVSSKSNNDSPPGIFDSDFIDSSTVPGNLHVSSTKSIEHLVKRYGFVTMIKQLSTDLAQRDAEITLLRRKNSIRENALIRLLNETGLSTNQVEAMVRERVNSTQSSDDQSSQLETLMEDAMSEHLDNYPYNGDVDSKNKLERNLVKGLVPNQIASNESNDDVFKTILHSSSLPLSVTSRNVSTDPMSSSSTESEYSANNLLNVVSNKFLHQLVPQNLQDAFVSNTTSTNVSVSVEMDNLATSTNKTPFGDKDLKENKGYINQYGFIYDNSKTLKRSSRTGPNRPTSVSLDKAFASKLLSIANDHDNNQKQGFKQWEEFLKKLTLKKSNPYTESTELLSVNGEDIRANKHLFKEFKKIVISHGIPMKYRPKFWYELSNGKLLSTPGEYYELVNLSTANKESEKQIELDIYRTMPFNIYFKDSNSPGLIKLQNILIAFARKYPDIGYCQGMNFIVANLLLVYGNVEEETFWVFVGLVTEKLPLDFFRLSNIRRDLGKLPAIFSRNLPKLWNHLKKLDVEIELIGFNWFISLFSESLPIEIVLKVWDLLMVNGYVELFKVSVALFKVFETQLLTFESCMDVYDFMKNLTKVNINLKGFELIRLSSRIVVDGLYFNKN